MNFPKYFADAESSFDEADFIIFGVPYDKTSSFRRGSVEGPDKIREASWNFETYNFRTGFDLKDVKIHDYGNLDVSNENPKNMIKKVSEFTKKILNNNKFPITLGGEHSITPGIIYAYQKDIAVVCLDAHIDFRNTYENEPFNHACSVRRISDHVDIKNIAVLGIRSAEKEEFEDAKKENLFFIDTEKIREIGVKKSLEQTNSFLKNNNIYLSLDIDVIDPAYAPGVGTPEPFGLTPLDIVEIFNFFTKNIIGFDVTEVCPGYDNGQTAILAAKLVRILIENIYSRK
jgi:agmatinase